MSNTAIQARDEAIERVDAHANTDWKAAAWNALLTVAERRRPFTTQDVWDAIDPNCTTHEPRAMGALIQQAHRAGICRPTDRWVQSTRVVAHARPMRVWEPAQ